MCNKDASCPTCLSKSPAQDLRKGRGKISAKDPGCWLGDPPAGIRQATQDTEAGRNSGRKELTTLKFSPNAVIEINCKSRVCPTL